MGTLEKANDLVDKFFNIDSEYYECSNDAYIDMNLAKQCALLCIDEIIEELDHEHHDSDRWEYWIKVKQETKKL